MAPHRTDNKAARGTPRDFVDIPMWQLGVGGLVVVVLGMLAGIKIADLLMSLWLS